MQRSTPLWLGALCSVGVLAMPSVTRASCQAPTPAEPLTVIPADGETGVPTDAHLWVLAGFGVDAELTLEGGVTGTLVTGAGPWKEYALAGVGPGDTVTWRVALGQSGDQMATFGPFTFQVGEAAAAAVVTPALEHLEVVPGASLTGSCEGLLSLQECFDTGQDTLVRVHVASQAGAVLYRTCQESTGSTGGCGIAFSVPASCPPAAYVHSITAAGSPAACFRVQAIGASGAVSGTLVACTDGTVSTPGGDGAGGGDGGGMGADAGAGAGGSGGCGTSSGRPETSALVALLLVAAGLVWYRKWAGSV